MDGKKKPCVTNENKYLKQNKNKNKKTKAMHPKIVHIRVL